MVFPDTSVLVDFVRGKQTSELGTFLEFIGVSTGTVDSVYLPFLVDIGDPDCQAQWANTTTTLTSSLNPANVGQTVIFTADVAPATVTGTVTFLDGATSIGAGTLSGLLGIGGGVLMVPAFTTWCRMPIKSALATSLACVGVLAVPSMITHELLGHINWLYALPLCIGVVPGARLGAHLTIRSSERSLRLMVGVLLGIIAVVYAVGEIIALV